MITISTHVLDTARGRPASGVPITLAIAEPADDGAPTFRTIGHGLTDGDGRLRSLLPAGAVLVTGVYRLTFDTATYFQAHGTTAFYPEVAVVFQLTAAEHYHVPLLLSPFGYSTYRGS